jgi:hypothetical protein
MIAAIAPFTLLNRRSHLKKFVVALCVLAAALTGPVIAAPSSITKAALVASSWDTESLRTALDTLEIAPAAPDARFAYVPISRQAAAGAPAFIVNFIAAGYDQTTVPCINCVVGGATPNLGLTSPLNAAVPGTTMSYLLSVSINSASGTCTAAVAVAAGTTVLYKGSEKVKGLSGNPGVFELSFTQAPVSYSGHATLTGKFTCGAVTSTVRAPLVFYLRRRAGRHRTRHPRRRPSRISRRSLEKGGPLSPPGGAYRGRSCRSATPGLPARGILGRHGPRCSRLADRPARDLAPDRPRPDVGRDQSYPAGAV